METIEDKMSNSSSMVGRFIIITMIFKMNPDNGGAPAIDNNAKKSSRLIISDHDLILLDWFVNNLDDSIKNLMSEIVIIEYKSR